MNKVAMLFATAALATAAGAQTVDNWRTADNQLVWKNGTNELCWRDANWTPATAAPGCDGAIASTPVVEKQAMPAPQMPAQVQAQPQFEPAVPLVTKMKFAANVFFDFDKSVLKPQGKAQLDRVVEDAKTSNLQVAVVVGHTDSIGSDSYNQKLSIRRAESVKAYLISKGIDQKHVYTEGRGEAQPTSDNKTAVGRSENRRVEIEMVVTRSIR